MNVKGRVRDIQSLQRTQRAAAVGRLLLCELKTWEEFLKHENIDFEAFRRRDLRANKARLRLGLSKEIEKFCRRNFRGMTEAKLEELYLAVQERLGLEIPLLDFEKRFAALSEVSLGGAPRHCTVVVSLWRLQTKFPEDMLSKDIAEAVRQIRASEEFLLPEKSKSHDSIVARRDEIRAAVRTQEFACRTCLLACFHLVEASLNGLAWDFSQDTKRLGELSEKKKKLVEDGAFRDKLIKYPEIVSGRPLWDDNDSRVQGFLDQIKPYRDALVHASPFSKPERYGGINKLQHIYRIDSNRAQDAALQTVRLLTALFRHLRGDDHSLPNWLEDLSREIEPANRHVALSV